MLMYPPVNSPDASVVSGGLAPAAFHPWWDVVVALPSIVSEDVVSIDDFIEGISFQPGLLYKVYIKAFSFHHANEMFVSHVAVGLSGYQFAISVSG